MNDSILTIIAVTFFLSLIAFFIGLIKPSLLKLKNRKQSTLITLGTAFFLFFSPDIFGLLEYKSEKAVASTSKMEDVASKPVLTANSFREQLNEVIRENKGFKGLKTLPKLNIDRSVNTFDFKFTPGVAMVGKVKPNNDQNPLENLYMLMSREATQAESLKFMALVMFTCEVLNPEHKNTPNEVLELLDEAIHDNDGNEHKHTVGNIQYTASSNTYTGLWLDITIL